MKYRHRILISAWVNFDLETDSAEPTKEEVEEITRKRIDGCQFDSAIDGVIHMQEVSEGKPFQILDTEWEGDEDKING